VAEALRAHAARTPLPEREHTESTGAILGGYGLLSGSSVAMPAADPPTIRVPLPADHTTRIEPAGQVAVGWVIMLAVLLGLATGAVVGLLTLL